LVSDGRDSTRQTVHQLFNLAVHMGKLHLQGGNFRVCLCRFLSARQCLVACQLLHHLLINNRFQFRSDDFPAPGTAFIVQPFCAAEILLPHRIVNAHKGIPAVPALDTDSSRSPRQWRRVSPLVCKCGASPAGVFLFGRSFIFQGAAHR